MEYTPYVIVAVVILLIVLGVYVFRNKEAILAEAWPDAYPKKQKKKKNIPPRIGAKGGAKKRTPIQ
jgi:protein-S-isoprenylcysteine O-methyltransferase Ste14